MRRWVMVRFLLILGLTCLGLGVLVRLVSLLPGPWPNALTNPLLELTAVLWAVGLIAGWGMAAESLD